MTAPLTSEQIADALRKHGGRVTRAARQLGVTRQTIYNHLQSSPVVQEALQESRWELVEAAEDKLRPAVRRGEPWAIMFVLNKLGRNLGWSESKAGAGVGMMGAQPMVIREVLVELPAPAPPPEPPEAEQTPEPEREPEREPVRVHREARGRKHVTVIDAEAVVLDG